MVKCREKRNEKKGVASGGQGQGKNRSRRQGRCSASTSATPKQRQVDDPIPMSPFPRRAFHWPEKCQVSRVRVAYYKQPFAVEARVALPCSY
jgi:hypothetical protein